MAQASGTVSSGTVSPITAEVVASAHVALAWPGLIAGRECWVQGGPDGRYGLWTVDPVEGTRRLSSETANLRTRVHEYGGRPWVEIRMGGFCYVEWTDQRLWLQPPDGPAVPISPDPGIPAGLRYAEPFVVGDEVWALRERVTGSLPTDIERNFVAIPLDGSAASDPNRVRILGAGESDGGHHFLAGLRLSPDGTRAAWIGWDHPAMSWDRSVVVVANVVDGRLDSPQVVAGSSGEESTCQLEWEDDDTLLYLSDRSGWWNLYRHPLVGPARNLRACDHELGGALWRPGQTWFGPIGSGRFAILDHGALSVLDEVAETLEPVAASLDDGLAVWTSLDVTGGVVTGVASGPRRLPTIASLRDGVFRTLGDFPDSPDAVADAPEWLPEPVFRRFDSTVDDDIFGTVDDVRIPAMVYLPPWPLTGPIPFIVHIHGGPTNENGLSLDLELAYFTSRGIGVVAPEYGGSTGFGRAWRERLRENWGVVDLADAVSVAYGLIDSGLADPTRIGIRGGSAGGFTTLVALTGPSPFIAGCARYPVADLLAFAGGDTHDLESQYLTGIVGPLPRTEHRYRERSPQSRAGGIHSPVLVLQGLDDRICPPGTTARLVDALRAEGADVDYRAYEGEQHGFRHAGTIADAIDREFRFFDRVFAGVRPSGAIR